MKVVMTAGVLMLCLFVMVIGMLLPDTFEAFALSKVATYAEDLKRSRIIDSPEYGVLEVENDRLHDELRACISGETYVPEEDRGVLQAIIGKVW